MEADTVVGDFSEFSEARRMRSTELIQRIRDNLIGQYQPVETPFGTRPLVYADYTASGRGLRCIERQLLEQVLPYYANTHSESSLCGAQTTALREQARQIIASALGCDDRDRLIFCGSGATAAINRFVDMLGLRRPSARWWGDAVLPAEQRPVVFIGPYEHHSNELPWRESIADVVAIPADRRGDIDQQVLKDALHRYRQRPLRIGSFSAASNVTGLVSDVSGITRILKQAGALACWDFAAGGPYLPIRMNDSEPAIDAVFLSPHKFVGGPGTPGVLAIKAELLPDGAPSLIGGGTVSWVSAQSHRYLEDAQRREEGGTPAILESIRAGLAVGLQQAVGTAEIARREKRLLARARQRLDACESIEILGPAEAERLAILPLRFHRDGQDLHYGYVVALLNDLFGIQARGGCSCAGPYGHQLLAIDSDRSRALEEAVGGGCAALRPGWVRLNLNYFIDDEECDYLLEALALIGELGWGMLPAYRLDKATGLWRHRDHVRRLPTQLDPLAAPEGLASGGCQQPDFGTLLARGRDHLAPGASATQLAAARQDAPWSETENSLRWFMLPADVAGSGEPVREAAG